MVLELDSILIFWLMLALFGGIAMSYNLAWWWSPLVTVFLILGAALYQVLYVTESFMMGYLLKVWLPISLVFALIATVIRIYIKGKSKRFIQSLVIISLLILGSTALFTYIKGLTTMEEAFLDELDEEEISSITIALESDALGTRKTELEDEEEIDEVLAALSDIELRRYYQPMVVNKLTLDITDEQNRLEFYLGQPLVRIDDYIYKMDSDKIVDFLMDKRH